MPQASQQMVDISGLDHDGMSQTSQQMVDISGLDHDGIPQDSQQMVDISGLDHDGMPQASQQMVDISGLDHEKLDRLETVSCEQLELLYNEIPDATAREKEIAYELIQSILQQARDTLTNEDKRKEQGYDVDATKSKGSCSASERKSRENVAGDQGTSLTDATQSQESRRDSIHGTHRATRKCSKAERRKHREKHKLLANASHKESEVLQDSAEGCLPPKDKGVSHKGRGHRKSFPSSAQESDLTNKARKTSGHRKSRRSRHKPIPEVRDGHKEDVVQSPKEESVSLRSSEISLTIDKYQDDKDDNESDPGEGTSSQPGGFPFTLPGISSAIKRQISSVVRAGLPKHFQGGRVAEQPVKPQSDPAEATSSKMADMQELNPYMEFITYGKKNSLGEHIIYLDPFKAPQKQDFENNDECGRLLDQLLTFTESFMEQNVKSDKFILVYRCLDEPQSPMMTFRWMGNFYHYLRDRYLHNLEKMIVYKPEMKLKWLIKMVSPFMSGEFTQKIRIVNDPHTLAREQNLPEVIKDRGMK